MGKTKSILRQLARYESRNVTCLEPDGTWPIVWERAQGMEVWDIEGRRYVDLTAAFGVAAAGHAHPSVVAAARRQAGHLLHAMGDVHPHRLKADLARALSRITFERWTHGTSANGRGKDHGTRGKTIFGSSGFEAVEMALKTARLATGRRGVIVFRRGYHGLGYGALNATTRAHFRAPFVDQLGGFGHEVTFPETKEAMREAGRELGAVCRNHPVGAVLVEPVQGRGGIRLPAAGFLGWLRDFCDRRGLLLILDEVYTGFGRTGRWFACEHEGVVPDLICLGKAMAGGFPISACVGRAEVMDAAWPVSTGEAIHTSTFLGHPVGCAMALAQIEVLRRERLPARSWVMGTHLRESLRVAIGAERFPVRVSVRGLGLMIGVALARRDGSPGGTEVQRVVRGMLRRGFIVLPEGEDGEVISLTPPLIIRRALVEEVARVLVEEVKGLDVA